MFCGKRARNLANPPGFGKHEFEKYAGTRRKSAPRPGHARPLAQFDQGGAQFHPIVVVHLHQPGCGPSDGCDSDDHRSFEPKVIRPHLPPRMIQPFQFFGVRVNAGEVRPLEQIAELAGEGEIVRLITSPVACGDDVLDVKRSVGLVFLLQVAIFTAIPGPDSHPPPQRLPHACPFSFRR